MTRYIYEMEEMCSSTLVDCPKPQMAERRCAILSSKISLAGKRTMQ
jgi:hypothetical protein